MESNSNLVKIALVGGLLALLFLGGRKVKQVFDKSQVMDLVKQFEGERLSAYKDVAGKWTIGVGHLIKSNEQDLISRSITPEESAALFDTDIDIALDAINKYVSVGLTNNQKAALASFIFNVGVAAFANSTLLKKLNAGDYDGAMNEFSKWNHSGGQVVRDLTLRRQAEASLFSTPDVMTA